MSKVFAGLGLFGLLIGLVWSLFLGGHKLEEIHLFCLSAALFGAACYYKKTKQ